MRRHSYRTRRDAGPESRARHVPLAQFRREVVGLLAVGRGIDGERAIRLVAKWDGVVRLRWREGKPPCNVADHIVRYERQGVVCPCGSSSASRDPDRRCRRCGRRARHVSRTRRASRDPECILLDEYANDHGTGDKASLMRKGKPGQSVMCRARNPRDLVDVHAVRDPERTRRYRRRRSRR